MNKYRPVAERLRDYRPVELRPGPEDLAREMKRCQDCGIPFCHASGCSLATAIPEINTHALAGRWETALAALLESSPFPEFTARVCPALCEGSCVQALHGDAVPFRKVELEVIERGFALEQVRPRPPSRRNSLDIAVVGSGPAGLAAAWRLNQAGAHVTVYERDARPGGFLRYGIPDFKLEKEVVDRRIEILAAEGIAFECGVEAGVDVSGRLLEKRHQAAILAVGCRQKRDLAIPGRELSGIHFAVDYLTAQNRVVAGEISRPPPELDARGKRVTVIGGGDTGSDCVGTALRQGALAVDQFEILPEPSARRRADNPWPEWPRTRRDSSSHEEGGRRRWNVSTLEFLSAARDPSLVGALRCGMVEWTRNSGGQDRPEVVLDSMFVHETDMVLIAAGFTGVEPSPLHAQLGVTANSRGCLPGDSLGRLAKNVYACGDAVSGPSLVVRALASGIATAEALLSDYPAEAKRRRPAVAARPRRNLARADEAVWEGRLA